MTQKRVKECEYYVHLALYVTHPLNVKVKSKGLGNDDKLYNKLKYMLLTIRVVIYGEP
jgi:hypothetical protein